jgi:hypothetical protein
MDIAYGNMIGIRSVVANVNKLLGCSKYIYCCTGSAHLTHLTLEVSGIVLLYAADRKRAQFTILDWLND